MSKTKTKGEPKFKRMDFVQVTLEDGRRFSGPVLRASRKAIVIGITLAIEMRVPFGKAEIVAWHPELDELLELCTR